jgi:diketogulonate reductase-like aldo/keto reductase
MNNKIMLYNGISMPSLIQGLPLIMSMKKINFCAFERIITSSVKNGINGFDTSHDYGKSEKYLGKAIRGFEKRGVLKREDIFITTKIGNGQQYEGNIEYHVNMALDRLRVTYIDLMLLHWPTPNCYINNWKKLEKIYESGKIKSIGLANCTERHLFALFNSGIKYKPHVVQFEYHPFRTVAGLVKMCKDNNIAVQAYTSLCQMIPLVTENELLKKLVVKYKKTIAQILLRWDMQQNIVPIFRSYNENRIRENTQIFDFVIDEYDMQQIFGLNIDYKYHPESMNCPGF